MSKIFSHPKGLCHGCNIFDWTFWALRWMHGGLTWTLDAIRYSCDGCPQLAFGGSCLVCSVRVSFVGILLCDLHSHQLLNSFVSFDIIILKFSDYSLLTCFSFYVGVVLCVLLTDVEGQWSFFTYIWGWRILFFCLCAACFNLSKFSSCFTLIKSYLKIIMNLIHSINHDWDGTCINHAFVLRISGFFLLRRQDLGYRVIGLNVTRLLIDTMGWFTGEPTTREIFRGLPLLSTCLPLPQVSLSLKVWPSMI